MIYIHEPVLKTKLYSRIIADSKNELEDFVELIGVRLEWIRTKPRFHFEIYGTKLQLALSHEKLKYLTLQEFEGYFTPNLS